MLTRAATLARLAWLLVVAAIIFVLSFIVSFTASFIVLVIPP